MKKQSNSSFINYEHFAKTYLLSAKILLEENKTDRKITDEKWRIESGLIFIPIIYLIRHSIELFLKSIYVRDENYFLNIHDLGELKNIINKNFKENKNDFLKLEEIIEKYNNYSFNPKILSSVDIMNDVFRYPDNNTKTKIIGENLKKLNKENFLKDIKELQNLYSKISF